MDFHTFACETLRDHPSLCDSPHLLPAALVTLPIGHAAWTHTQWLMAAKKWLADAYDIAWGAPEALAWPAASAAVEEWFETIQRNRDTLAAWRVTIEADLARDVA